jgi:hypothetical protein
MNPNATPYVPKAMGTASSLAAEIRALPPEYIKDHTLKCIFPRVLALREAAGQGNLDEVTRLLNEHACLAIADGLIPTRETCPRGSKLIRWNMPETTWHSALATAAAHGHTDIVRVLLEGGADVRERQWKTTPALLAASKGGHNEVVRLLSEAGARTPDLEAIIEAVIAGHVDTVELLLELGHHDHDDTRTTEENFQFWRMDMDRKDCSAAEKARMLQKRHIQEEDLNRRFHLARLDWMGCKIRG